MRNRRGKNRDYSFKKKLREEGKTTPQFEMMLQSLTIEDLISLKLELSAEGLKGKLFGFPIYKNINNIVRESIIRFALAATTSKGEAANLLGINIVDLVRAIRKMDLDDK